MCDEKISTLVGNDFWLFNKVGNIVEQGKFEKCHKYIGT